MFSFFLFKLVEKRTVFKLMWPDTYETYWR